ncbi:hypothetical protein ACP70R_039701 [Stipagrostis hirtigluma subsp. patula]
MSSLLPILLFCSSLLVATTNADDPVVNDCPSNTNYTRGSAFQANLDALLSSLPAAAAASSGFAKNITGAAPGDQAYGLAQCRADVNASDCRACLDGSVRDMARMCPGRKNAMVIYDRCLLRHSSASFFGAADTSVLLYLTNTQNTTGPVDFEGAVMNFIGKAAYASPRMFAAGNISLTPFVESYSLAQCTRDLAHDECNSCLVSAVASIPKCCGGKQGGQVIYRSCSIRFEAYPFYNVQSAEAAMSPTSAPGGGPVNGTDPTVLGSTGTDHSARTPFVVSIPIAVTLLVLLLFAVCLYMRNRKRHKRVQIASAIKGHEEELRSSEFLFYDLSTLQTATDNFSAGNKLGEGGFGPVYKGTLQNGQEIAVKRLSTTSRQGQVEMKNEVVLVAKLQHKNLVRLLGCCIEEHEKLLVYEFLSNNSLHKILFDPARQQELSWRQRHKIIEGIGRGLLYLHEDSRLTVIHRDLKASNILLDADMNPKISDFGLAKLFNLDSTSNVGNTNHIAGTYGYMAPEYARHGIFSDKSDIFSYGVLVLEIVTSRRRNTYARDTGTYEDLLPFVWRHWSCGGLPQLLDGCWVAEGCQPQEMLRCVHVALLCVQEDPQLRPAASDIILMLNSHSIALPAPTAPPAFADAEAQRVASPEHSVNFVSVSEFEPR